MISWKEDINSQNIEEERKNGGQENGLYNRGVSRVCIFEGSVGS